MSPYVGMDGNPVALSDPYGLATGGDDSAPVIRKGGRRAAEKRAKGVGGTVHKSKTKSGTYYVDYHDKANNLATTSETYEETKFQKVLSWIGDKVESASEWLGEAESTVKDVFRDKANKFTKTQTYKATETVAHEGFLPVAKGINYTSQVLLPTKSAMNLISGATTGKNLDGQEMTKGDYAWETVGVLPIGMADDAARGAKGLIDEVGELGAKTVKKQTPLLLNQFNSVEGLIEVARSTFGKVLKHGELQGFVSGDANAIFKAITNG